MKSFNVLHAYAIALGISIALIVYLIIKYWDDGKYLLSERIVIFVILAVAISMLISTILKSRK